MLEQSTRCQLFRKNEYHSKGRTCVNIKKTCLPRYKELLLELKLFGGLNLFQLCFRSGYRSLKNTPPYHTLKFQESGESFCPSLGGPSLRHNTSLSPSLLHSAGSLFSLFGPSITALLCFRWEVYQSQKRLTRLSQTTRYLVGKKQKLTNWAGGQINHSESQS